MVHLRKNQASFIKMPCTRINKAEKATWITNQTDFCSTSKICLYESKNGSSESIHKVSTFFWCSKSKIFHHEKFECLNNRFKKSLIGPNNSFNNLDFKFHKQLNHGKGNWASFWDVPRKSIHFYHNYIRTQEATLLKIFSKIAFLHFYQVLLLSIWFGRYLWNICRLCWCKKERNWFEKVGA